MTNNNKYYPHLSVDCVLIGCEDDQLKILLVERTDVVSNEKYNDKKLPGRLIYMEEDIDEAAISVLKEYTGIDNSYLKQFKCFGSPKRTSDPRDVRWLENAVNLQIGRLVTVAYMSIVKIGARSNKIDSKFKASWVPLTKLPQLAFDHNLIIEEAIGEIRKLIENDPIVLSDLLPTKFTALQLRRLFEQIYNKEIDVRNFHKKIKSMKYIVELDEKEENVSHRAARYYKFDKKKI